MAKRWSATFPSRARAAWLPPPSVTIEVVGARVPRAAWFRPPPFNGVDRKLRRVVVLADPHPPRLVGNILHTVGTCFTDPQVREVVALPVLGVAGGMPLAAPVLEGHARLLPRRGLGGNMLELGVSCGFPRYLTGIGQDCLTVADCDRIRPWNAA